MEILQCIVLRNIKMNFYKILNLKKEWDALDPEFNEIRRIMKAKDLAQSSLPKTLT